MSTLNKLLTRLGSGQIEISSTHNTQSIEPRRITMHEYYVTREYIEKKYHSLLESLPIDNVETIMRGCVTVDKLFCRCLKTNPELYVLLVQLYVYIMAMNHLDAIVTKKIEYEESDL